MDRESLQAKDGADEACKIFERGRSRMLHILPFTEPSKLLFMPKSMDAMQMIISSHLPSCTGFPGIVLIWLSDLVQLVRLSRYGWHRHA